jgi:hypothetical protein
LDQKVQADRDLSFLALGYPAHVDLWNPARAAATPRCFVTTEATFSEILSDRAVDVPRLWGVL